MEIVLNGQPQTLPQDATVADLLRILNLSNVPAAVEINKTLIPKRDHAAKPLAPGDRVEVVTLVGGG
ncbi:MAG TPA: sulfur carrier protein ThiS [Phycisphaerales bacterium]|nr:sulfur carrier protein ThiS [Phycisphaerales bacterium]